MIFFLLLRLKQGYKNDKSQTETSLSSSSKTTNLTNGGKALSIFNSLVPYIDSDKEDSDGESSSLSGEDNGSSVIVGKVKNLTDQKVPDKKPLVMRPKEDPSEQFIKESPSKKCLVLKPQHDDDDSPVNEIKREFSYVKKCLVLKPKDDEPFEFDEPVKKCLVRLPKDDHECNTPKVVSHTMNTKDSEKKKRHRENGYSEQDSNKGKARLDHNHYNG